MVGRWVGGLVGGDQMTLFIISTFVYMSLVRNLVPKNGSQKVPFLFFLNGRFWTFNVLYGPFLRTFRSLSKDLFN